MLRTSEHNQITHLAITRESEEVARGNLGGVCPSETRAAAQVSRKAGNIPQEPEGAQLWGGEPPPAETGPGP